MLCERTWGRLVGRTHPSPGNHEYNLTLRRVRVTSSISASTRDRRGSGYYSFNLGAWHIISLNSNRESGVDVSVSPVRRRRCGCSRTWRRNRNKCTLAYWHHPLFSSGQNGDNPEHAADFQILYNANADSC